MSMTMEALLELLLPVGEPNFAREVCEEVVVVQVQFFVAHTALENLMML